MIKYFLWIGFLGIVSSKVDDYCNLCKNHTMCEFKGRSPLCGEYVESGITTSEAEEIVFLHNLYRSKVANGSVICGSPGPQPPVANMNVLMWDEDLAEVAQHWADQCNFDHDKCRRDARFQVGQNMFVSIGPETVDWRQAIKSWYSAVLKFDKSTIDSFQSNVNTNSYTQLVWANTKYIGCGRTIFETTSSDQENSLKYDKFISSTINGSKNRATNEQSDTDGAKITRQKRDYVEYFGEASMNEAAARGALGTFNPIYLPHGAQIHEESIPPENEDQGYYVPDQYGEEEFNPDEATGSLVPWNLERNPERIFVYPQASSYQQPSVANSYQYYQNRQTQPVQQTYVSRYIVQPQSGQVYSSNLASYSSNYNDQSPYLRSINFDTIPKDKLTMIGNKVIEEIDARLANYDTRKTDGYDSDNRSPQPNKFIPRVEYVNYYGGKPFRATRSVNSENVSNGEDDSDDTTYESKKVLEKKFSHQPAAQQISPTRKQILVCNYGPTGNVIDQPIYIKGKPCSKCPPNTTCKNGLCSYN